MLFHVHLHINTASAVVFQVGTTPSVREQSSVIRVTVYLPVHMRISETTCPKFTKHTHYLNNYTNGQTDKQNEHGN